MQSTRARTYSARSPHMPCHESPVRCVACESAQPQRHTQTRHTHTASERVMRSPPSLSQDAPYLPAGHSAASLADSSRDMYLRWATEPARQSSLRHHSHYRRRCAAPWPAHAQEALDSEKDAHLHEPNTFPLPVPPARLQTRRNHRACPSTVVRTRTPPTCRRPLLMWSRDQHCLPTAMHRTACAWERGRRTCASVHRTTASRHSHRADHLYHGNCDRAGD